MIFARLRVIISLLMFMNGLNTAHECDTGWFGEACRFKCRCEHSTTCGPNGECPKEGICSHGFFGPGCQYVDQAVGASQETETYLIDEDENTCNNHASATSVHVSFHVVPFTWFRLHVNNPQFLGNFTVALNEGDPCFNERRYAVSLTAIDVSCDVDYGVSKLNLSGAVAAHVCSIYISGGRNVALRQPTNQSSLADNSGRGVDGNIQSEFEQGSCTHTLNSFGPAEWILNYTRPYTIVLIIIYNRSVVRHRIRNYILQTYNEKGKVTNRYKEWRDPRQPVFFVYPTSRTPIVSLTIHRTEPDETGHPILTLCEVETYGEAVCPDNYYGLFCNQTCPCRYTETCFTVTGACSLGCQIGAYGYKCAHDCSSNCRSGHCFQRLGMCEECNDGYSGVYCSKECDKGTYGFGCRNNCSRYCVDTCNNRDGTCVCRSPYTGRVCTDCVTGTYGENCTRSCSAACVEGCHLDTGECKTCSGARKGKFCEECPEKLYGASCFSSCSEHCLNGTCDPNNGTCPVCIHGYSGSRCKYAPAQLIPWAQILSVVAIFALFSVICCCCLMRKLKRMRDTLDSSVSSEIYSRNSSAIITGNGS